MTLKVPSPRINHDGDACLELIDKETKLASLNHGSKSESTVFLGRLVAYLEFICSMY